MVNALRLILIAILGVSAGCFLFNGENDKGETPQPPPVADARQVYVTAQLATLNLPGIDPSQVILSASPAQVQSLRSGLDPALRGLTPLYDEAFIQAQTWRDTQLAEPNRGEGLARDRVAAGLADELRSFYIYFNKELGEDSVALPLTEDDIQYLYGVLRAQPLQHALELSASQPIPSPPSGRTAPGGGWPWHARATRNAETQDALPAAPPPTTPWALPKIAVLDTGVMAPVDPTGLHRQLGECRVVDARGLTNVTLPRPNAQLRIDTRDPFADSSGHGTQVARLACEAAGGLAQIFSIPVLDERKLGTTADLAAALLQAAPLSLRLATVDIINLSLGYQPHPRVPDLIALPPYLRAALRWASLRGVHMVAASGNRCKILAQAIDCEPFLPAGAKAIIPRVGELASRQGLRLWAVGGINHSREPSRLASEGAVDLYAPSEGIYAGQDPVTSRCTFDNGTSLAAPQVAGAAALLYHHGKAGGMAANLDQVFDSVGDNTAPLATRSRSCGNAAGILDVCKAAATLGLVAPCAGDAPDVGPSDDCSAPTLSAQGATQITAMSTVEARIKTIEDSVDCYGRDNGGQGMSYLSTNGSLRPPLPGEPGYPPAPGSNFLILEVNGFEEIHESFMLLVDCPGQATATLSLDLEQVGPGGNNQYQAPSVLVINLGALACTNPTAAWLTATLVSTGAQSILPLTLP